MKKFLLFFVLLTAALVQGCSSDNGDEAKVSDNETKRFVGRWVLTESKDESSSNPYMNEWHAYGEYGDYYLVVNADYTFEMRFHSEAKGKIRADAHGGLYLNDSLEYFYEWEGGNLILKEGSRSYKFVKAK